MNTSRPLTRRTALAQAWPLTLANLTTPLLGLTDTAVLGHGGRAVDLAALALGTLVFNFLYWSMGFLRMGTTGFVAQAEGGGTPGALPLAFARALVTAAGLGVVLLLAQPLLSSLAFDYLGADPDAERLAAGYIAARIGGAPAFLAGLVGNGLLIGLGRSKTLLIVQLFTNGLNAFLDVVFVTQWSWGAAGVGWGTALAEGSGGLLAVGLGLAELRRRGESWPSWTHIWEQQGMLRTLAANRDILVRTVAMMAGFSYFTDQGARYGTMVLAGNHLLLQLISLSAFFLDSFAHVAEARVGVAWGRRSLLEFDRAVRVTTELAVGCAVLLALLVFVLGPFGVELLTSLPKVRSSAVLYLAQVSAYVLFSVVAFQLDGIFVGASATSSMRNTALVSVGTFLVLSLVARPFGNSGLWWAFVGFVCVRGLTLLVALPALRSRLRKAHQAELLEKGPLGKKDCGRDATLRA